MSLTPTGRVAAAVLCSVLVSLLPSTRPELLGAAALVVLLAVWTLGRAPRRALGRALPGLVTVAALLGPAALFEPSWALLGRFFRAAIILTAVLGLTAALGPEQLARSLRGLGVPAGLCRVVGAVARQLVVLVPEGRRLVLARELRGVRGVAVGPELLGVWFARSLARARRGELALELRGYVPGRPPAERPSASDAAPLAALGLALGALLIAASAG